ncbi:hypothetical protein AX17_006087 [Amanita inopinata Kibby_2008]|nr:hypothetical protein AX17_006087 [Amanita inopinata Kibby_2008]
MSFIKNIFRKKKDEDYETILSVLAEDVRTRHIRLSEIRLRERRSTLLVTLYTLAAWVAYVSLWYMRLLPDFYGVRRRSGTERAIKGIPVVLGPILVLFIRRIVQIWYRRKGDAEERTLQELMKKQRGVVEDIKKKTNYYSTQELLQKYDSTPVNSPLRQRVVPGSLPPSTPQRPRTSPEVAKSPAQATLQTQLASTRTPFPSTPPRKQWYDKLADALLGDDDHATGASTSRYALICENCFAHNGLVKESMWEDTQYICPKCQHFNPSARSKRERQPSSRSSPQPDKLSSSPEPQRRSPSIGRQSEPGNPDSPSPHNGGVGVMEIDDS